MKLTPLGTVIFMNFPKLLPDAESINELGMLIEAATLEGIVPVRIQFDDYVWTQRDGWTVANSPPARG